MKQVVSRLNGLDAADGAVRRFSNGAELEIEKIEFRQSCTEIAVTSKIFNTISTSTSQNMLLDVFF